MKFFRALLALFFAWIIIFWIWKWYTIDDTIQKTDIMRPVWNKLSSVITNKQSKKDTIKKVPPASLHTTNPEFHPDITTGTLSLDDYESIIVNDNPVWPWNAERSLLIYCDFDSVYCKQMMEEGTSLTYQLISKDKLKIFNKWYITTFNWIESTYNVHHAWQCAQKTATWPQRTSLLPRLFELPYQTIEQLAKEWEELWIEWFNTCLTTTDSTQKLKLQNKQAKDFFWIKSLPTLIFYNVKTQNRYSIPGLYTNEELDSTFKVLFGN